MDDRGIFGGVKRGPDGSEGKGYGMTHDDVKVENYHRHTGAEASLGKIFVGGIAQVTTDAQFAVHFGRYGQITESVINKDLTGQHRGFGFVTYADPSVVDRVIKDTHIIDGKQVEVKRATVPRGAHPEDFETKKIFVGGLPKNVSDEEFRDFFSKFGVVKQHYIARKRSNHQPRGFGFIVFESEQTAKHLLDNVKWCEFAGSMVTLRKPEPKKKISPPPPRPPTSASNPRASFSGVGDAYGGYRGVPFYGRGLSSDSYRPGGAYGGGAGAIGFGPASYGCLRPNLLQGYSSPFRGGYGRGCNFGAAYGGLSDSNSMPRVSGGGVFGAYGWGYNAGLSGGYESGSSSNSGWAAAPHYGNREGYSGVSGAVEVPLGGYVQVYDAGFSGSGAPLNGSRRGDAIEVLHGDYGQGYDADFSRGNGSQRGGPLHRRRGGYGSAGRGRSHPYGPWS